MIKKKDGHRETNGYIRQIKELVLSYLAGEQVRIVVFGSRARNDYNISSDLDIGIIPMGKTPHKKLTLLRDKIENMNVPYKVEIVDFAEVSDDFKKEALKEVAVWQE